LPEDCAQARSLCLRLIRQASPGEPNYRVPVGRQRRVPLSVALEGGRMIVVPASVELDHHALLAPEHVDLEAG
jgi:hypothetical protein